MLKGYEEYKATGIIWIPNIPVSWDCKTIMSIFIERKEKNNPVKTKFILSLSAKQGVIPYSEKIGGGNKAKEDISDYNVAQKGDLLINCMNVVAGSSGVSNYYGAISPVYYALYPRNDEISILYYEYLFRNQLFYSSMVGLGNGIMMKKSSNGKLNTIRKRIPMEKLNRVNIPVPPLLEQRQIVSYLNWKTAQMDFFVSAKEKEIRHLEELKKAIVNKAVTRGLNDNVPMKKTGIDWLPKIPAHWDVVKMKYLFDEISDKNHPDEEPLVASQNMGVVPKSVYGQRTVVANGGFENFKLVKIGDFVISLRSFQGGLEYAYYQGIISPAYTILRCNEKSYIPYFKLLFKSIEYIALLKTCVTGIREGQNIDYNVLRVNYLPIPPLEEQKKIMFIVSEKLNKIDKQIMVLNKEIALVQELRTRIIADAVTGRIDVRQVAVPEEYKVV